MLGLPLLKILLYLMHMLLLELCTFCFVELGGHVIGNREPLRGIGVRGERRSAVLLVLSLNGGLDASVVAEVLIELDGRLATRGFRCSISEV